MKYPSLEEKQWNTHRYLSTRARAYTYLYTLIIMLCYGAEAIPSVFFIHTVLINQYPYTLNEDIFDMFI